MMDTE